MQCLQRNFSCLFLPTSQEWNRSLSPPANMFLWASLKCLSRLVGFFFLKDKKKKTIRREFYFSTPIYFSGTLYALLFLSVSYYNGGICCNLLQMLRSEIKNAAVTCEARGKGGSKDLRHRCQRGDRKIQREVIVSLTHACSASAFQAFIFRTGSAR